MVERRRARDGDAGADARPRRGGAGGARRRVRVAALGRRDVQHLRPAQRDQPAPARRARAARAHPLVARGARPLRRRCATRPAARSTRPRRSAAPPDPTGLVKGWAVERAAALLARRGRARLLPRRRRRRAVRGGPWRVGIRHPRRRDRLAAALALRDGAVATSGAYERGAAHRRPGARAGRRTARCR